MPRYTGEIQPLTENIHVAVMPIPKSAFRSQELVNSGEGKKRTTSTGYVHSWQQDEFIVYELALDTYTETKIEEPVSKSVTAESNLVMVGVLRSDGYLVDARFEDRGSSGLEAEVEKINLAEFRKAYYVFPEEGIAPDTVFNLEDERNGISYGLKMSVLGRSKFKGRDVLIFDLKGDAENFELKGYLAMDIATGAEIYAVELRGVDVSGAYPVQELDVFEVNTSGWD